MGIRKVFIGCCLCLAASGFPGQSDNSPEYRQWIEAMKTRPRGPFKELRWFCNDGTVLPPKEYACVDHGGGYQHGAWSENTLTLREHGYKIANLLAGYDPEVELKQADFLDAYNQLLIEKYLVAAMMAGFFVKPCSTAVPSRKRTSVPVGAVPCCWR